MEAYLVYMTAGDLTEAQRIAEALIQERLAACVNILPGFIDSLFHWKGAVENEAEVAFLAKTTARRFPALAQRVRELHSYETPCVVALPIVDGDPAFLAWIDESTRKE